MTEPSSYSYPRYLKAKKTVDARALNQRVWTRFVEELSERATPLRILEVGGGVGAAVERIIEALEDRSVSAVEYTFIELEPDNVRAAKATLRSWARDRGYRVSGQETQVWSKGPLDVSIRFITADLFDVVAALEDAVFDALVAQAVFDLLHIPDALGALRPLLHPGGLWYLPLQFDGVTAFEPPVDSGLDARIERLYHASMSEPGQEEGRRVGAHSGRRLLRHLRDTDDTPLEVGASDWVVYPQDEGYLGEEAYFLHHILHFVETELVGHPELDDAAFSEWLATRRQQIENGDLIYIAHQLDVLAHSP